MPNLKKLLLIIKFFTLVVLFVSIFTNFSFGASDIISSGNSFIEQGKKGVSNQPEIESKMTSIVNEIGGIMLSIGTVVLIVVGMILGLKYMSSNDQTRAKAKQTLIWYCVAVALVYGAVGITRIILGLFDGLV